MEFINESAHDAINLARARSKAIDLANLTKKQSAIINVEGKGYAVVGNDWVLDRNYYHGEEGKKMFFTVIERITA